MRYTGLSQTPSRPPRRVFAFVPLLVLAIELQAAPVLCDSVPPSRT
jgi:hypothetical protein